MSLKHEERPRLTPGIPDPDIAVRPYAGDLVIVAGVPDHLDGAVLVAN